MPALKYFQPTYEQGVCLIHLHHEISSLLDDAVLSEVDGLVHDLKAHDAQSIVVDFGQIPYFGSSLLEALRELWTEIESFGGRMAVYNVSPVGQEILDISRFNRLWPVCDTREQALAAVSG